MPAMPMPPYMYPVQMAHYGNEYGIPASYMQPQPWSHPYQNYSNQRAYSGRGNQRQNYQGSYSIEMTSLVCVY